MANYTSVNSVSASNMTSYDSVLDASIYSINGVLRAPVMSKLIVAMDNAYISYVGMDDITNKSKYQSNAYSLAGGAESWDLIDVAYGKDASGEAHWVAIRVASSECVYDSTNANFIDDKDSWTNRAVGPQQWTVLWGNDVWVTAGNITTPTRKIWRSTDGSTWSSIDLTGLTDIADPGANDIKALTSDGEGRWWFGVGSKIYKSSDDAATWALEHTLDVGDSSAGMIRDLVFTNSSVMCLYKYDDSSSNGQASVISAAASDTTTWGSRVHLTDGSNSIHGTYTQRCAAGNGRVVCIDKGNSLAVNVDGTSCVVTGSRQTLPDTGGNTNAICTDGTGTWYVGSDGKNGGDILRSTDNGLSWSLIVSDINKSGDRNVEGLAVDLYLPL
tara:strand:- start:811 stop:1968 length:1158 start_codon:yes stop_codon:yes gene_type:complete